MITHQHLTDRLPNGYALVCVTESGTWWLLDPDQLGVTEPEFGAELAQPHEIGGSLPPVYRDRIAKAFANPMCLRRRADGQRCRKRVASPTQPCRHHGGAPCA
ncbi:hypothetical protein MTY66_47940 [Mycolicibacterium sp. TY66]|nr:hypothetical protein MTY66_47940 [Mycolicibacterium sp. TY66]BCJ79185.1 hypothetical protein MTY81_05580 [Mycolicibacterium sp. TY81]